MSTDPRTELTRLLNALEAHLSAVIERNGEHDPAVDEGLRRNRQRLRSLRRRPLRSLRRGYPLSVYGDDEEDDLEEILDDEDDIEDDDIEYED